MILFFEGPFSWPVLNQSELIIFLFFVLWVIFIGYFFGIGWSKKNKPNKLSIDELKWRQVYKIGAISSILIFIPSGYLYTGKFPWDLANIIGNQGDAYDQMLKIISQRNYARDLVATFRIITAPFAFAVLPLAVLKWKELRKSEALLFWAYIACRILFSLMRGTDKEIGDLIISAAAAMLVKYGKLVRLPNVRNHIGKKFLTWILIVATLLVAFNLFSDRKLSRLGSSDEFCIGETAVTCADYRGSIMSMLNRSEKFGFSMLTAYLSQGYYGLSLALNERFESTFGLGHSSFLMSTYESVTGNQDLYQRGYMYKLRLHGWDDRQVWSTAFPWIASDIGFPATLIVVMLASFMLGKSWIGAVRLNNDFALMVFVLLLNFFIYLPANNQLAQTGDAYLSFWVWILFWIKSEHKQRIFKVSNV